MLPYRTIKDVIDAGKEVYILNENNISFNSNKELILKKENLEKYYNELTVDFSIVLKKEDSCYYIYHDYFHQFEDSIRNDKTLIFIPTDSKKLLINKIIQYNCNELLKTLIETKDCKIIGEYNSRSFSYSFNGLLGNNWGINESEKILCFYLYLYNNSIDNTYDFYIWDYNRNKLRLHSYPKNNTFLDYEIENQDSKFICINTNENVISPVYLIKSEIFKNIIIEYLS